MKKQLIFLNAVIVVVGFAVAFLLAGLRIQTQYREEFTNRLDTALAILKTRDAAIHQDPEGVADEVGPSSRSPASRSASASSTRAEK